MNDEKRRARAHRTVDRLLDRVLAHDMAGFAALWAPDGTMEFPFGTDGTPERLEGRAAVAEYVADYNRLLEPRAVTAETRHDTGDPDTIVVEFEAAGRAVVTGRDYRLRYVTVITVGDGGVASYRDYWSPAAVADVIGSASLADADR